MSEARLRCPHCEKGVDPDTVPLSPRYTECPHCQGLIYRVKYPLVSLKPVRMDYIQNSQNETD